MKTWVHKYKVIEWVLGILGLILSFILTAVPVHYQEVQWCDYTINFPEEYQTIPTMYNYGGSALYSICLGVIFWFRHRDYNRLHSYLLSLLLAYVFVHIISNAYKVEVGHLRPDFVDRCHLSNEDQETLVDICANGIPIDFSDPYILNQFPTNLTCSGNEDQGRKSFPAGHGVTASIFGFYTMFFLAGELKLFNGQGKMWKLWVCLVHGFWGIAVASTRYAENGHGAWDCIFGVLLSFLSAGGVYLCTFHSLFGPKAGSPYASSSSSSSSSS